uniref:Uncharacterized protein n=1 Tax=Aplanochytrium stocchinoi TaxID=215587 RepID=A0A7S3LNV1_9STRA
MEFRKGGRFSIQVDQCHFHNEFNCVAVSQVSWFPNWLIKSIVNDAIVSIKEQVASVLRSKIQNELSDMLKDSSDIDVALKSQNAFIFNVIYYLAYITDCSRNEIICQLWGLLVRAVENTAVESFIIKHSGSVHEFKLLCNFLTDSVDFAYFALCGPCTVSAILKQHSPPFFALFSILGCTDFDEVVDVYWSYEMYYVMQNLMYWAPHYLLPREETFSTCLVVDQSHYCWPDWFVSHLWPLRYAFYKLSHSCPKNMVTRGMTILMMIYTMEWLSHSLLSFIWYIFQIQVDFFFYTMIPRNYIAGLLIGAFFHTFERNPTKRFQVQRIALWVAGCLTWVYLFMSFPTEEYIVLLFFSAFASISFIQSAWVLFMLRILQEVIRYDLTTILGTFMTGYGIGILTGSIVGCAAIYLYSKCENKYHYP